MTKKINPIAPLNTIKNTSISLRNSLDLKNSNTINLPIIRKKYKNQLLYVYKDFKNRVSKNGKYDLIVIDGPFGDDSSKYSRIDILSIVPQFLAEDFVIIIDDYERSGEQNMAKDLMSLLKQSHIKYSFAKYFGEKGTLVIASNSYKWVCTMS